MWFGPLLARGQFTSRAMLPFDLEKFFVRQHRIRGHLILLKYGSGSRSIRAGSAPGEELIVGSKGARGSRRGFVQVCLAGFPLDPLAGNGLLTQSDLYLTWLPPGPPDR
ncbi:hypothetical protein BDW75DRAFT_213353 [Aspergillus navahoensis]